MTIWGNAQMRSGERGIALYLALVVVIILTGISLAMISDSSATGTEYAASKHNAERLLVAESGIAYALLDLMVGGSGNLGDLNSPHAFGPGEFVSWAYDDDEGRTVVTAIGTVAGESRALRVTVRKSGGALHHAIFAGNSSGDPTYSLNAGGIGNEADDINGDIFSGGDITISGDADVDGKLSASGEIYGADGESGSPLPPPDIWQVDLASLIDVDVAAQFDESATYEWNNDYGGTGWQVPEELASHIFRVNPDDRKSDYESTEKNDYFLEDPYETIDVDDAPITLTGLDGSPGEDGNKKVYYIDGNLWLHNKRTMGFQFADGPGDGIQVTFIVKGNIYFSDNLTLEFKNKDGVAFIALEDPDVADSGNVYFGDPVFGTLEQMDAFMYAQNTFYDLNLDETGSSTFELNGIMSAGNHVSIERDFGDHHTKMTLNFDDRIKKGKFELPGLPKSGALGTQVDISELDSFEMSSGQARSEHPGGGN